MKRFVAPGDIYVCDFGEQKGSVQSGERMAIIIDNAQAGAYSPVIHVVPLTSQQKNMRLHYLLQKQQYDFLDNDSVVLCEQYQLIDKSQLKNKIGKLEIQDLYEIVIKCKQNFPF